MTEEEEWWPHIKEHCGWCNAWIGKSVKRYMVYGNSCTVCSGRATEAIKPQYKNNYKEIDDMRTVRQMNVKKEKLYLPPWEREKLNSKNQKNENT